MPLSVDLMTYLDEVNSQIATIEQSLDDEKAVMASILQPHKSPDGDGRGLGAADARLFDAAEATATVLEDRLKELRQQHITASRSETVEQYISRQSTANKFGGGSRGSWSVVNESGPYRADAEHSYFRDLWAGRFRNDPAALDRLRRNDQHVKTYSTRAALNAANGTGGEFVPPLWLIDDFVAYARPGRPTADLCTNADLPHGTDSISLPKLATGTAVGYQTTQNTGVTEVDLTTTSVNSGVYTIAGGQTFSVQLFDQSPVSGQFDRVIMADLAADMAKFIDYSTVLNGSGTGQPTGVLNLAGTNTLTWTTGSPTPGGFISAVADAQVKIQTTRFKPATACVMHPRRWAWLISQTDSAGRPLVPPGVGTINQNSYGSQLDGNPAQGHVGALLGLPVVTDASIPTNLGGSTNQDVVIVAKFDDLWLWESTPHADVFPQTYAANASLYARLYQYVSFQPARYPGSISTINGSGLSSPSFAA